MPLEIKELIIRAQVDDHQASTGPMPASNGQTGGAVLSAAQKSELVAACVEAVMRILEAKKER